MAVDKLSQGLISSKIYYFIFDLRSRKNNLSKYDFSKVSNTKKSQDLPGK